MVNYLFNLYVLDENKKNVYVYVYVTIPCKECVNINDLYFPTNRRISARKNLVF